MRVNTTKAKLAKGKVVLGGIVSGFSPEIVELLALLQFDFVFLDCEHGSMNEDQVEHMVRAAESFGITPIARIPNHEDSTILRYLDRGVQGLIIPHINTAEAAVAVAAASRYHPLGHRGSASGRAHDYGVTMARPDSMAFINDNVLVIPMCEEVEAVSNLDSILAVPGIDVVHVASGDLGQSMGHPPMAEVRKVMSDVVKKTKAAGKWAGIGGNGVTDHTGIADLVRDGAQFVTIPALGLLRIGAEQFRDGVAAAIAAK